MSPHKLRSSARFAGVGFLLVVLLSVGFAQKLALERSAEWGRRSAWLGQPNGYPPQVFDITTAAWYGDGWTGGDAGDVDGDGDGDFILLQAAAGSRVPPGALARVLVVAPRGPGKAAVLFDSGWARRAPPAADAAFWHPRRVCGQRLAFDGVTADGRDSGARFTVAWKRAAGAYHQQVVRVDPLGDDPYNRISRRGG